MSSARRFLRLFGFIPSFQRVAALLGQDGVGSVPVWLEMAKCTSFGLYILLEDLTIVSDSNWPLILPLGRRVRFLTEPDK